MISKLWYRRKRVQVTQLKSAQLIVSLVAIIPVVNGTKITETKSERIKRRILRKLKKIVTRKRTAERRKEKTNHLMKKCEIQIQFFFINEEIS